MFPAPLSFALFFIVTSFCISLYLPKENSKGDMLEDQDSTKVATSTQLDTSRNKTPESQFTTFRNQENASIITNIKKGSLNTQVINATVQEDSGLQYYRQLSTRVQVINFYSEITGNREVALAILEYANKYNISISLAFALAYSESRYNCNAINSNSNKSIDRGLFQLNSKTFPYLEESSFFDPYISAKQGLSFLHYCLETAGNEIGALAMYNAGPTSVKMNKTPQMTLNHIANITQYQKGLEELFKQEIIAFNEIQTQPLIAMVLSK